MLAADMRVIPANHDGFQSEKTVVEQFIKKEGLKVHFLPKYHCELNLIERVWGQVKVY